MSMPATGEQDVARLSGQRAHQDCNALAMAREAARDAAGAP
jgi:hypothetical protein